jgi:hypothetical protein
MRMKVNVNLPCLSALMAAALLMGGCASQQYMGVSLKPGGADPAVQALAARASTGDKQAQYELGRWFEDSTDANGMKKAIKLYQIAATPRGGSRMMYSPGPSGVTTSVVSSGQYVGGLFEATQRLEAIAVEQNRSKLPANATELRLSEAPYEKYVREKIAKTARPNSISDLSYEGKFLSLLNIKEPVSAEIFNSPIISGDTRTDFGLCKIFEAMLSRAWSGEMKQCQSSQWEVFSNNASVQTQDYYTLNYGHSGLEPDGCRHVGECFDPIFSSLFFDYPTCGWFVTYRFKRGDGSRLSLFVSLGEDVYLTAMTKHIRKDDGFNRKRTAFCNKL